MIYSNLKITTFKTYQYKAGFYVHMLYNILWLHNLFLINKFKLFILVKTLNVKESVRFLNINFL